MAASSKKMVEKYNISKVFKLSRYGTVTRHPAQLRDQALECDCELWRRPCLCHIIPA